MTDEMEIQLTGGRVTQGVVRVGETVRRPPAANAVFVRRLLTHLAAQGFDGAPAWLGIDQQGRDIFSFIAGEVPPDLAFHADDVLRAAATLIRRFHDLVASFAPPPQEVVRHNDLSPCNFVFRGGLPVAIIDFDAAAPGTRARDLGYAAWLWLDIGNPEVAAAVQGRRLALFVEAYGGLEVGSVVAAMQARQAILAEEGDTARLAAGCLAWTRRHEDTLRGN